MERDKVDDTTGISVQEAGRRGGESTLERRGTDFFREIGRKGGQPSYTGSC